MARMISKLADTIGIGRLPGLKGAGKSGSRLSSLSAFGSNPGALLGHMYIPPTLAANAPLVVVLHGCTQTASDYDRGSGWSHLADRMGFALLFPEQQRSNNPNLCFNWFVPGDTRRGQGEALSIQQMVRAMCVSHKLDEQRIFVTGLSAGGAMASTMLATYPELFAGGAIIGGLPFGAASSMGDAFARMRGDGYPPDDRLGALVLEASDHTGPWPRVSVWHGTADTVVNPANAERILGQWKSVHALSGSSPVRDRVEGADRQTWRDQMGRPILTSYSIAGMGHGVPLATRSADSHGVAGPFMLEAGISSTLHIARSWGLGPAAARAEPATPARTDLKPSVEASLPRLPAATPRPAKGAADPHGIGAVIESALRAAGLMR